MENNIKLRNKKDKHKLDVVFINDCRSVNEAE